MVMFAPKPVQLNKTGITAATDTIGALQGIQGNYIDVTVLVEHGTTSETITATDLVSGRILQTQTGTGQTVLSFAVLQSQKPTKIQIACGASSWGYHLKALYHRITNEV